RRVPGPPPRGRTLRGRHVQSPKPQGHFRLLSVLGLLLKRPHLDRECDRPRELATPFQRGVEVGRVDDAESADVLLALDVGPIGYEHLASLEPNDRRRACRVQTAVEDPGPSRLHLRNHDTDFPHHFSEVDGRRRRPVRLIDAQKILRQFRLPTACAISGRKVAMSTPMVVAILSTNRSQANDPPSEKRRRPDPRTSGWINRMYSSTRL